MLSSCTFPSGHDSYVPLPCNPGKSEGKFEVSSSHTHTSETTFLPATVTNDDHTESTVTMFIVIAVVSSVILLFSVISVLAMCASCRRRRKKNYRKTQKAKEGPIRTISQNFSRYATRGPKETQSIMSWGGSEFSDTISHMSLSSLQVSLTDLGDSPTDGVDNYREEEMRETVSDCNVASYASTSSFTSTTDQETDSNVSESVTADDIETSRI